MLFEKLAVRPPVLEKPDMGALLPGNVPFYFLRLDRMHPLYGGNKLLKIKPFLLDFDQQNFGSIATMGGAFSNHLVATAAVCIQLNIECHAIIRTYAPDEMNPVIKWLRKNNVRIYYTSPEKYRKLRSGNELPETITGIWNSQWIPEGGIRPDSFQLPDNLTLPDTPFDIAVSAGTGTTAMGFARQFPKSTVYVFPAIRNWSFPETFKEIPGNLQLVSDYHFGGFGKWNLTLIKFMDWFYSNFQITLDVIYTGKMVFGIVDQLKQTDVPFKRPLVIIHTGGFTGNIGFDYRFPGVLGKELVNRTLLEME